MTAKTIVLAALVAVANPVLAQDWPTRPLTMVVAFPAGGADDILARILAQPLSELLGQPVNVENIGGAAGMTGTARVAKAAPDGYQFVLGTSATHALSQTLHKNPPYRSTTDFTPVALIAEQPFVLIGRKDLPGTSLDELIAYAKANPRKIQYASAGEGSGAHLACALFNAAAGIKAGHIAYNGGAPAMKDLVAGRIDYFCPVISIAIAPIENQAVKGLAILTKSRAPILPQLASAQEQGLAEFSATTWFALFLPKGVPANVAAKLHQASFAAMDRLTLRARMKQIGAEVVAPERRTPEYLAKFVESEIEKWKAALKTADLKLD